MAHALDPTSGGVERVYHNLVPELRKRGYNVYATYNVKSDYDKESVYSKIYYLGNIPVNSKPYFSQISSLLKQKEVGIIICPFPDFELFRFFSKRQDLKVFFHIHNLPSKIMYPCPNFVPLKLRGTIIGTMARKLRYYCRFNKSLKRADKNGMKIVLLSDGFRSDFNSFCKFSPSNIVSIPNPIPINAEKLCKEYQKEKRILYVGRINTVQKRFQSVLNIWGKIQDKLPDYHFDVVGGGNEKEHFEHIAQSMNLKNIEFHGFQEPTKYYERSLITCMTSNYEGFGMVLVEAMLYGSVPFAFDTFAALHDIIDDGVNGFIVPPFDEDKYAETIVEFTKMETCEMQEFQHNCIEKAKTFSVDKVCDKWESIIKNY